MNILLTTLGTRGDVQPFVALGKGLRAAGHSVTLCTSSNFETFVRAHGLTYAHIPDDIQKIIESAEGKAMIENTTNLWQWFKSARKMRKHAGPMQRRMLESTWAAAEASNPDVILFHPKAYGGWVAAQERKIPAILALPMPLLVPTKEYPMFGFPDLGGRFNRLSHRFLGGLATIACGQHVKQWRKERGMAKTRRPLDYLHDCTGRPLTVLHAFSRHVVPPPADWPSCALVTGYWFLDENDGFEPSAELESFLRNGPPPVYVGFGSMAGSRQAELTRIIVEALKRTGVRGLIATGWGGLNAEELPPNIFQIKEAPHDWLFPRVAAVVHHGGAGTTAAGLRAGKPTLICPFIADQPFWGRRVHALGVGPAPIAQKKLTVENLSAAILELSNDATMRENAGRLGEKIRGEDGIASAVAAIEAAAAGSDGLN